MFAGERASAYLRTGGCNGMAPAPPTPPRREEGVGPSDRVPWGEGTLRPTRLCLRDPEGVWSGTRPRPWAGGGHWPPACPQMEVSSDAQHFHVHAQEHRVLQFAHRHRPLAAITRVQVLSDQRLAQVQLARRGLGWG